MDKHVKERRIFAAIICVMAVALLVMFGVMMSVLMKDGKQDKKPPASEPAAQISTGVSAQDGIVALELESSWAAYFSQRQDRKNQEAYLDSTLDRAEALGANTLLLTGRVGDDALFRMRKKTDDMPEAAAFIEENDRFLRKFDPLDYLKDKAKDRGIQLALLATDSWGTQLFDGAPLPEWLQFTAKKYKLAVYSPMSSGAQLGNRVYQSYDPKWPDLLKMDTLPGNFAAAIQTGEPQGLLLGGLEALEQHPDDLLLLNSWVDGGELPRLLDKDVPDTLGIVNPANGQRLWSDQIYVIGTSVPDGGPVTVNGSPVAFRGDKGVWGVLMPLADGPVTFTASQDGVTQSVTVNPTGSGGGGGGGGGIRPDGSRPAEWGQKLRITAPLASLLSTPGNSDSIMMTLYEGGVAEVASSKQVTMGQKRSYVYQLQNGGFVRAQDCELLPPGTPDAAFTGTVHETSGSNELITFMGGGTPVYTHVWNGSRLTITFLSARFNGQLPTEFGFTGASVTADYGPSGFALNFEFSDADPLWGYHVDYTPEGGTRVVLKHQPRRSADPAKPLSGVTVMLDPGHGGTDMGAIGSSVESFPQEKDMNLAEARAAQYRLEQLGATVLMTRSEDVFVELGDRVKLMNNLRPDFFISLHHNSSELTKDLTDLSGTECYWFYTEGKPLAQNLVKRITQASGRPVKGDFYDYFYVTRSNLCPAVLLETGFVCGPKDYELGTDVDVLWAEGAAVAQAILDSIPE